MAACTNIEALTSAVVSTPCPEMFRFSPPNSPAPPTQPHILTDGIFVETDYEPKHFRLGSSLCITLMTCATLSFSFFSPSHFPFTGDTRKKTSAACSKICRCWAPTAGPVQAKSFGLTCPVAPRCLWEWGGGVCIASIQWFHAAWSLSVGVAKAAKGGPCPPGQTMLPTPLRYWQER